MPCKRCGKELLTMTFPCVTCSKPHTIGGHLFANPACPESDAPSPGDIAICHECQTPMEFVLGMRRLSDERRCELPESMQKHIQELQAAFAKCTGRQA